MKRYNRDSEKWVEKELDNMIGIVIDEITTKIDDVVSIILAGGFGRGEGSIIIEGKTVYPLNDFDIYVVTQSKHTEDELNEIGQQASKKIGKAGIPSFHTFNKDILPSLKSFFYVDLKAIPFKKLKTLPPMIRYYELKYSGNVIFGDNVLDYLPEYQVEDIPLAEGLRLLMNRMSHLVEYFYPSFLDGEPTEPAHELFLFHTIKVYNASCDALLLLAKKFPPTYLERVKILEENFDEDFPELYEKIPEFPEKVREFTELKINMDFSAYKGKDFELWKMSREYIGIVSRYFLERFLGDNQKINTWDDFSYKLYNKVWTKYYNPYISDFLKKKVDKRIENKYILSPISTIAQSYLNWVYFRRVREIHKKTYYKTILKLRGPELTFFSALPFTLYSLRDDGSIDLEMLERGKQILGKTFPVNAKYSGIPIKYWEQVAQDYSNAYILFAFLKII